MTQINKHNDCKHTIHRYDDPQTMGIVYACSKCHTKIEIPVTTLIDGKPADLEKNLKQILIMAFGRIPEA